MHRLKQLPGFGNVVLYPVSRPWEGKEGARGRLLATAVSWGEEVVWLLT